jgi:hypothetical protein
MFSAPPPTQTFFNAAGTSHFANSGHDRGFVVPLLFCDDVHALEVLRVDGSLHHSGLFCFVDD